MKYYAVRVGKKTGIFETWDECKEQVEGFVGAEYKSFSALNQAFAFPLQLQENRIFHARSLRHLLSFFCRRSPTFTF